MATKNNQNKEGNAGKIIAIGAGVAAVAAAGYFLFGPNGKKNRKNIKGWTLKMKGEVLENMEKAKEITEPIYNAIVDKVAKKYLTDENRQEVEAMVSELKKHWRAISQNAKKNGTAGRKNKA